MYIKESENDLEELLYEEEPYEEKEERQYYSLEDKLREVGMSIHDFI